MVNAMYYIIFKIVNMTGLLRGKLNDNDNDKFSLHGNVCSDIIELRIVNLFL